MGSNRCACQIYVLLLGVLARRLPGLIVAYTPLRPLEAEERQKAVGKLNSLSPRL